MEKRSNKYIINLKEVELKDGSKSGESIEFEFENHDNILEIIKKIQERNLFNDNNQSIEFSVGLKLFSEVLIRNRNNPLFEDFAPAFKEFMQKLKGK